MIAQIETSTFCNLRCWYCQNAHYKNAESQIMPMGLFEATLKDISSAFPKTRLNTVSFAAYNEPTLDPFFKDRLRMLSQHGFNYWFITNGSRMTPDLVDFISQERPSISSFHINLPAIDPDDYQQATAAPGQSIFQIRENLSYFFKNRRVIGPTVTIIVHGKGDDQHVRNFTRMKEFWREFPVEVIFHGVMNRAGMLSPIAGPAIDHGTDMVWCSARYFENLYIGVKGNLFLCCHDYYQKYSFGNIVTGSLKTMYARKKRKDMLRKFTHDFCRHCSFALKFEDIPSSSHKASSKHMAIK